MRAPSYALGILLVLGIVVLTSFPVGCTLIQQASPAVTPTPFTSAIATIPPSSEPGWLTVLFPKPGQIVNLDQYNASHRETSSGSLPAPDVPASVCIQIWPGHFLEEGDYWDSSDVTTRTSVRVDDTQRKAAGTIKKGKCSLTGKGIVSRAVHVRNPESELEAPLPNETAPRQEAPHSILLGAISYFTRDSPACSSTGMIFS